MAASLLARPLILYLEETILVTGGFIGGNFILDLVGSGAFELINLNALTYAGCLDTLAQVTDDRVDVFVHGTIRTWSWSRGCCPEIQHNDCGRYLLKLVKETSLMRPYSYVARSRRRKEVL